MIEFFWCTLAAGSAFWICAALHEIHQDLVRIGDILRDKQLEIPSPLMVERYESK